MFRISLLFIAVLTAATAAVAAPPDPLIWIWQNAWPKPQAKQQHVPLPLPAPKVTRSIEHRKVHRPAPKIVKREAKPLPKLVRPAPIIAKEQRERPKIKRQVSYCDALRERFANIAKRRLLSCAEMKTARPCERPGDRVNAPAAQLARGAQCWASGQL